MSGGLPEGLVTSTDSIEGEIESVDRVAVEDITKLWKVYSTNKNLLANDVGKRLENFFWRIWSNGRIRDNIRGNQVAMLFHSISEGNIIRTTPIQSPRLGRFLPMPAMGSSLDKQPFAIKDTTPERVSEQTESGHEVQSDDQTTPADDRDPLSDVAEAPFAAQNNGKGKAVHRPPPILKGTRTGPSKQQPKTARILTPTWKSDTREEGTDDEVSPTTSKSANLGGKPSARLVAPSESDEGQSDDESRSPTGQPKKSASRTPLTGASKTDVNPSTKVGKKKSAFVASTASTKRRPTMVRRKSSQTPSSNSTSKVPSPHLPSQSIIDSPPPLPKLPSPLPERNPLAHPSGIRSNHFSTLAESPPEFSQSTKTRSYRTSHSTSPTASRPFQDSSLGALSPSRGSVDTTEAPPLQDWLVDRDFRAKFVDRSHTSALSMSRAILPSSSTSQTIPSQADDVSRLDGKGKGKAKTPSTDYTDSIVPLKPPGAESSAIEDDDEDEPTSAVLPRTKSQLTLLVENERKRESEKRGKQKRSGRR